MSQPKVTLVTGASRGAGLGIARALGQAGAVVYVTGRTSRRHGGRSDGLPGTVEDTAEAVTRAGGVGIPVLCDHTQEEQVEALLTTITNSHGRLDLLVNNAWGGYERHDLKEFTRPFWDQPKHYWQGMFEAGVRASLSTSRAAAPLMMTCGGLIIHIGFWSNDDYLGNLVYDLAKNAMNRMARTMAHELRPHGVAVISLSPGFMRTERVVASFAAHGLEPPSNTESVEYIGRAVAALLADDKVLEKSGRSLAVGDLAREYGFTDLDGSQPPAFQLPEQYRLG